MKKYIIIFCMIMWSMTACSPAVAEKPATQTLVNTDTITIERTGTRTVVYDLVAGTAVTFQAKKVMVKKTAPLPVSNMLHDTPTLQVKQIKGILGVLVKSTGEFYLV